MNPIVASPWKIFVWAIGLLLLTNNASANVHDDPSEIERLSRHAKTLLDVAVHTENDPKFLDWAESYCDSLEASPNGKSASSDFRERIAQTRSICADNLNHRAPILEMFRGRPAYMGMADDAVEYALETAMDALLRKPVAFQSTTMISDGALIAVVQKGTVPDDLWEIGIDALDVATNYTFTRVMNEPLTSLDSLVARVQLNPNSVLLEELADSMQVNQIGLFSIQVMDVVEERLWKVGMEFRVWNRTTGFGPQSRGLGFCEDKTGDPILFNLLDLIAWSFLLLIGIATFEFINWRGLFANTKGVLEVFLAPFVILKITASRIPRTALFLVLPIAIAFITISLVSGWVPGPTTHYKELDAKLWIIGMAFGMSLLPTVLNFFVLNRLRLDGFHSMASYRDLFNVSLFGSYVPFIYLHEVNGTPLGLEFAVVLVVATWMAADLLAFNVNEVFSKKRSPRAKGVGALGLFIGVTVVIVLTFDMIGEASMMKSLQLSLMGGVANLAWRPLMKWAHKRDAAISQSTQRGENLEAGGFVGSVVPEFQTGLDRIQTSHYTAGFVKGPRGIGKTRLVQEWRSRLQAEEIAWNVFFGDCDEVQDEGHLVFEPFVEAFGAFLNIEEIQDRTAAFDAIGQSVFGAIADVAPVPVEIGAVEQDVKQSLEDFAMHLVERLEKTPGFMLLILDDLQWLDADSKRLLEVFWGMVSRNPNLSGRMKLICTYRVSRPNALDRLGESEFDSLMDSIGGQPLMTETSFVSKDFLVGLSEKNENFTLSKQSLKDLNDLFNQRQLQPDEDGKQVVSPLYIIRNIDQMQASGILKPGSDGWVLTRSLTADDLLNSEEIDIHYHELFRRYPAKWMRVLESASIVGRSFDATVLAAVWGHELLDVLDFLEQLEGQGILQDIREEDNVYRFKDKRAIAAIKSFYPNASGDRNARQIVIEYNKRLLAADAGMVQNRAVHSSADLRRYLQRLTKIPGGVTKDEDASLLMEELAIRFAIDAEVLGTSSLEKLASDAWRWGNRKMAQWIDVLLKVLGSDALEAKSLLDKQGTWNPASEGFLGVYVRLLFDRRHGLKLEPGVHQFLSREERQGIGDDAAQNAQGGVWVGVVALLLHHPHAKDEDRQLLAAAWRAQPPLMGADHLLALKRFEIELWEQSAESTEEVIQRWEAHWNEVVLSGAVRQRKVVAKAVLWAINRSKDIHAGVEWFIRNERQLRSAEGRIQLAWWNVLEETLMENPYARRLLCREHEQQLRTWFEELNQYLELRFEPSRFSEEVLAARIARIQCEIEWQALTEEEFESAGRDLLAYTGQFDFVPATHRADAFAVAARVTKPKEAAGFFEEEYRILIELDKAIPQTEEICSVCSRLSMHHRNRLHDADASLRWAEEGVKWGVKVKEQSPEFDLGSSHYYVGAALVELERHEEAARAFERALEGANPTTDQVMHKVSVIQMHRGASLIKAGNEQGKEVLREAITNLESPQIASLVSPVNLKRIASMKKLL
jgi:hypothetical protein